MTNLCRSSFFLVRQAVKDIPHRADDSRTLNVRAVSKSISEAFPAFMDLRVKIHGQPEVADIEKVKAFLDENQAKLSTDLKKKFAVMLADMQAIYQPVDLTTLNKYLRKVPKDSRIWQSLADYIEDFKGDQGSPARTMATAEKLAEIREEILHMDSRRARLALLDISNVLEELFFLEISKWQPKSVGESTDKICYTGLAAMGSGFIEQWEWDELVGTLAVPIKESMTLEELQNYLTRARSLIEWGTGTVNGVYKDVVNLYSGFEPLAYGFFDDRIRGSVLLSLGRSVSVLSSFFAKSSNLTNQVLNLPDQSAIRGLNPVMQGENWSWSANMTKKSK